MEEQNQDSYKNTFTLFTVLFIIFSEHKVVIAKNNAKVMAGKKGFEPADKCKVLLI